MDRTNLIQVERSQGYSREQAYKVKVCTGYTKNRKADDAMLAAVKKEYSRTLVVESQIKEIRNKLIDMANTIRKDFPKCKPVEVGKAERYDDYGYINLGFGGSGAYLEFSEINPLMHTSWIAAC